MNLLEFEQVYNVLKKDYTTFEEAIIAGLNFKELKDFLRGIK